MNRIKHLTLLFCYRVTCLSLFSSSDSLKKREMLMFFKYTTDISYRVFNSYPPAFLPVFYRSEAWIYLNNILKLISYLVVNVLLVLNGDEAVRFEVLTTVLMKIETLWRSAPYRLVNNLRRFGAFVFMVWFFLIFKRQAAAARSSCGLFGWIQAN